MKFHPDFFASQNKKISYSHIAVFAALFIIALSHINCLIGDSSAEKKRVCCIGNSITEGSWLQDVVNESYPAKLAQYLGTAYDVLNLGNGGACILKQADGPYWSLDKIDRAIAYKPGIIVIMLGTNDSKPYNWVYKDSFEVNYSSFIDTLVTIQPVPKIWLCLPPPAWDNVFDISGTTIQNEVIPLIKKVARQRNLPLIDCHTSFLKYKQYFPDGVHPDKDGAAYLAALVSRAIGL